MTRLRSLGSDERGEAATTVILMMPIMLMLLWFAVFTGRMVNTQQEVLSAARDGSRAASVQGTAGNASAVATAAVEESLRGAGLACQNLAVSVNTTAFEAGGRVEVTVSCEVNINDVTSVWTPGTKVFEESSVAFVDTFRGGDE